MATTEKEPEVMTAEELADGAVAKTLMSVQ